MIHSANSLLSVPATSISAALPSICCDLMELPMAIFNSPERYPEEINTGASNCDRIGCNTLTQSAFKLSMWAGYGLLDIPFRSAT